MFSTTKLPHLPHMMAHASSADAPFDSEVLSTADLDSLASATTPSATTSITSTDASLHLDILAQLMDTSSTTSSNSQNNSATDLLLSDHSILATSTSTSWTASPSISPMVLKLESPLLSHLEVPSSSTKKSSASTRRTSVATSTTSSTFNTNNSSRKRSAVDPADKEAKARERVLRNRAAAQESRDKKRKYVAEIEASNETLQEENCQLLKRLKTVESDNLSLHQRLETLTAQFAQMQQQLASSSPSVKHNTTNQPGVGFCQSAVLAKKDRESRETDNLTNSPQQKLAPTQRNPHTMISTTNNKPRRVYSMTMKTSMTSKQKSLNREARSLSDPSAAPQKWMEISCRPSCNNNHNCRRKKALTLSSSAAASFPTVSTPAVPAAAYMMVFLANMLLPQLMLNFSILFLISTGAQSSNPQQLPPPPQQEQELRQAILTFIRQHQRLFSSPLLSNTPTTIAPSPGLLQSRTIKDDITSLHPSVIEEIVTEFRQGRKEAARGLLVRALVSSRLTLDSDEICKRLSLLRKK
ncbi:hypothetical protein BG015_003516 [Linnemannia schmuckeri]|uniref:BZIP domain-containing protein n=1 Tax=Linnemannia schmuckeri TaxID=64567 RepID=A0A9P5RKV2_9FUNG|nr:hypothetical protein BG015_003516 [Linnemannia schmuckeri]